MRGARSPTSAADGVGEYSIEIDPRTVSPDDLRFLRELGFNRVSFGVQDFDPAVQQAVNRIQSFEHVRDTIAAARAAGYHSISADLIYGLPLQTVRTFSRTLEQIRELAPDRLAVFNYAHMPHIFGAQKQINAADLPDAPTKLHLLQATIEQLTDGGYEFIGLDHFALPGDSLVRHQRDGTLYRNFQGYSTFSDCELLGFGISAISMLDGCYSQHEKARSRYYRARQKWSVQDGAMLETEQPYHYLGLASSYRGQYDPEHGSHDKQIPLHLTDRAGGNKTVAEIAPGAKVTLLLADPHQPCARTAQNGNACADLWLLLQTTDGTTGWVKINYSKKTPDLEGLHGFANNP